MRIVSNFQGKLTPFQAYSAYLGLKMHFTQSYDWFKYYGRVNAKEQTFETRRDRYSFVKLAGKKDPIGMIVANLLANTNAWVGEINSPEGDTIYLAWKKRQESLIYSFKEDLKKISKNYDEDGELTVDKLLIVPKGEYPILLDALVSNQCNIETVVLVNTLFNFTKYWDSEIIDPVLWAENKRIIQKYKPFLEYDKEEVKEAFDSIILPS